MTQMIRIFADQKEKCLICGHLYHPCHLCAKTLRGFVVKKNIKILNCKPWFA